MPAESLTIGGDGTMSARDGFVIETYAGEEVDFVACTKNGSQRERVERDLLMGVEVDRFTVRDTREETGRCPLSL